MPIIAGSVWTPEIMVRCRRVGGTALSADGRLVAYTVAAPVPEEYGRDFRSQIWLASTDGTRNEKVSGVEDSCTDPSFSPDGSTLAFLVRAGEKSPAQIWTLSIDGGIPRQLSRAPHGISAFRWAPDSRRIAFTMPDSSHSNEHPEPARRDPLLLDSIPPSDHLHVADVGESGVITEEPHRLTEGKFHVNSFSWSPDGSTIAFGHQAGPSIDLLPTSDISKVRLEDGGIDALVRSDGADIFPIYSPDGDWIVYASDGGHPHWAHLMDLYLIPSEGGNPKRLAETRNRNAIPIGWSADGSEVFFVETDRTSSRVFALPVSGRPPRAITPGKGTHSSATVSRDGSTIALVHESSDTPPEVFVGRPLTFGGSQISRANTDFPAFPLGKTELVQWTSGDGTEIEGLLTYPVNYRKGRHYPLVVQLHGGPASAFLELFTAGGSVYPIQAFAQQGYLMLCPNPRGSDGYGMEFRFADVNDWGGGDAEDVLSGVDSLVRRGIADPDSLGICGWSYGGYLAAVILTRTGRFKAASVGAAITNLISFAGTTDIPGYVRDYFQGEVWEKFRDYAERSPVLFAGKITTPTQIIHGELDVRVPPSQGRELHSALKRLGVPTEMIVYPTMAHAAVSPDITVDLGTRILQWFDRYFTPVNA
jgi:dipeptidyl aminopeptidase/acylaminoacyl peptidase